MRVFPVSLQPFLPPAHVIWQEATEPNFVAAGLSLVMGYITYFVPFNPHANLAGWKSLFSFYRRPVLCTAAARVARGLGAGSTCSLTQCLDLDPGCWLDLDPGCWLGPLPGLFARTPTGASPCVFSHGLVGGSFLVWKLGSRVSILRVRKRKLPV